MKRLKANKHMLHVLKNCNSQIRKSILKLTHPELIKTLCEICENTLCGNIELSNDIKKKLKAYKNHIRKVTQKKVNLKTKRKILIQKGGFLPILLSALLSGVIGNLIA